MVPSTIAGCSLGLGGSSQIGLPRDHCFFRPPRVHKAPAIAFFYVLDRSLSDVFHGTLPLLLEIRRYVLKHAVY